MQHRARIDLAWFPLLACLAVPAAACNRGSASDTAPSAGAAAEPAPAGAAGADACARISDWKSEIIELPPEFAPTLPAGQEELRFAPGMFEPTAPTYFTYAFVIRLAQPASLAAEPAAIESLLDRYYQGLVAAVARARELTLPLERVDATVTGQAPAFQATVSMFDAFGSGAPLTLHMDVSLTGACLRAAASPQPRTHEVWRLLRDATACLPCAP